MLLSWTDFDSTSKKINVVVIRSIFTCIYYSIFLYIFILNDDLHLLGKRTFFKYLLYLLAAECLKAILRRDIVTKITKIVTDKEFPYLVSVVCVFIVFSILFFHLSAILFGAPIVSEQEKTFMFAVLLTSLTTGTTLLHLGTENGGFVLCNLLHHDSIDEPYLELMKQNILLTLIGTWLGAVFIPLDWDRPWQKWPISCSLGALIGYVCSHFLFLIGHYFKTNEISRNIRKTLRKCLFDTQI